MATSYIITFVQLLLQILSLAIFCRILLSWVDPTSNMRLTQVLRDMTEPVLGPIRKAMPQVAMFDFSPVIALLLLNALGQLVVLALR